MSVVDIDKADIGPDDILDAEPVLELAMSVDQLKQAIAFSEARVPVPELGVTVLVRSLSAHARSKLMNGLLTKDGEIRSLPELQARMFAHSVVQPAVSVDDAREIARLWPAPVWDRVQRKVDELSPPPKEVRAAAAREFPDPDE